VPLIREEDRFSPEASGRFYEWRPRRPEAKHVGRHRRCVAKFQVSRNKNLLAGGWTATTQGDVGPGSKVGWGFKVDYPNDLWKLLRKRQPVRRCLEAVARFPATPGVRATAAICNYQASSFQIRAVQLVRQEVFENRLFSLHRFERKRGIVGISHVADQRAAGIGRSFEFTWDPHGERLVAPFEVAPGVVIPPGSYDFTRWRLGVETSDHAPSSLVRTPGSAHLNGHLTELINYVRWTSPGGKNSARSRHGEDFGHLPVGNFVQRLWSVRAAYAWNPNLVLSSFIQYDTDRRTLNQHGACDGRSGPETIIHCVEPRLAAHCDRSTREHRSRGRSDRHQAAVDLRL